MIPEVRHNGTRTACGVCTPRGCLSASGSLGRAASTCNEALCARAERLARPSLRCAASMVCNDGPLCAAPPVVESLRGVQRAGLAIDLDGPVGLGRSFSAAAWPWLCEPAAESGWISRPETTAQDQLLASEKTASISVHKKPLGAQQDAMQAHLASVLKGVVKDKSKGALSRLLGERAAASRLLERIEDGATWHARIGIVLVDDARLRSYTPRAAVEWALRYETDLGLECTRGGTWFSQQPGSKQWMPRRTSPGPRCSTATRRPARAPGRARPTTARSWPPAGETRHLLRAKAEGWTTADFKGTKEALKRDVLSDDSARRRPSASTSAPTPSWRHWAPTTRRTSPPTL